MGCVGSKVVDLRDRRNVFRVVKCETDEVGQLEVTSTNLTFYRKRKDLITQWPLQCLRRYGYDHEIFMFEAGRRCPSGQGIYSFSCVRADALFSLLQEYIQESTYNNNNNMTGSLEDGHGPQQAQEGMDAEVAELRRGLGQNPSSNYIILHGNSGPHSPTNTAGSPVLAGRTNDNYMEPLGSGGGAAAATDPTTTLSSNIYTNSIMSPGHVDGGNLYQQLALAQSSPPSTSEKLVSGSPTNTAAEEFESPSTPHNTYMNVTPGELSLLAMANCSNANGSTPRYNRMNSNASVGCYENLDVSANWRPEIFSAIEFPALSEPCTPGLNASAGSLRKVNYILLDLDNQSASSSSPSGSTSVGGAANSGSGGANGSNLQTPESPVKRAGYATIDFNKTVALSNSTTAARRDLK